MIIGIGSELRSDDGAGVEVVQRLRRKLAAEAGHRLSLVTGGTTPENVTAEIVRLKPDLIIFVDAADFGGVPGNVRLLDLDEIVGMTFSSHTLPLTVVIDYLRGFLPECLVQVLGIQPQDTEFGEGLSKPVESAVAAIVRATLDAVSGGSA